MRKIKFKNGPRLLPYNLEYTGIHKNVQSEMQLHIYDDSTLSVYSQLKVTDLESCIDTNKTNWLNIHGLNDVLLLQQVGVLFTIDNFILADILNTSKRTKIEEQNEFLFFNIKSLLPSDDSESICVEQISF